MSYLGKAYLSVKAICHIEYFSFCVISWNNIYYSSLLYLAIFKDFLIYKRICKHF